MIRTALAPLLLALALPAQWLGPTNVYMLQGRADVFVNGGKVYVLAWGTKQTGLPHIEMWGEWRFPGRMQVELSMVGLAVNDPRPCAREVGWPAQLCWNESAGPVPGWTIPPDGWLWSHTNTVLRASPSSYSSWFLTYQPFSRAYTICSPVGWPELIAMLFEIKPL